MDGGDAAENREDHHDQKYHAVGFQFFPLPRVLFRQDAFNNFKAIKGMNRDEIKNGKDDVEHDDGAQ